MTLAQQLKSMSLPGTPAYRAAEAMEAAEGALLSARKFIENGVEFGYILMPEADTPDAAHETLPDIHTAIAKLRGEA